MIIGSVSSEVTPYFRGLIALPPLLWLGVFGRRPNKIHKLKYLTISIILLLLCSVVGPSFDVAATPLAAASAPSLGNASTFSVLAALSMSAAAAGTTVSGDLGLSPGEAISEPGFGRWEAANILV